MDLFERAAKNDAISGKFNNTMGNLTAIIMKKVLEIYKGFEGINQLVDVEGRLGTNLKLIVSKYPQIKGINFDLPHVIKDAPHFLGVDHVGGDMFIEVPQGEVIFMKACLSLSLVQKRGQRKSTRHWQKKLDSQLLDLFVVLIAIG
ncbi:hypothetical protein QUC31_009945 [Theobroma cacao]